MAVIKAREHRKNELGLYDTVHKETESGLVLNLDGTTGQDVADDVETAKTDITNLTSRVSTAEGDITALEAAMPGPAENASLGLVKGNSPEISITNGVPSIGSLSSAKVTGLGSAASADVGIQTGDVPVLDADGKIPLSMIHAAAITDTFVVNTESAMLALNAHSGDVAVRTDLSKSFILTAVPASALANWQELLHPESPVESVNGMTGAVTISTISGNAASATKLETAREIELSGDAVGSASFDGSGNIDIATTVSQAAKLKTERTISLDGDVAGMATGFDGTSNITIPTSLVRNVFSLTIDPGAWAQISGAYRQIITDQNFNATSVFFIAPSLNGATEQDNLDIRREAAKIYRADCSADSIALYATETTTIGITLIIFKF